MLGKSLKQQTARGWPKRSKCQLKAKNGNNLKRAKVEKFLQKGKCCKWLAKN